MKVRVLAVSDEVDSRIYSSSLKQRMGDVQLVLGCGDLPGTYLEFLADALDRPVYFVLGNHQEELLRLGIQGKHYQPLGCINLGGRVVRDPTTGVILAGIPGSPRYCEGPEQYAEWEIRLMMLRMWPRLLWNRLRYGRCLDVLIAHSPPRDIGDRQDPAHRGFIALRRFLHRFHPRYLLHGHVHLYDRSQPFTVQFEKTTVINVYPYHVIDLKLGDDVADPAAAVAGRHQPQERRP